MTFGSKGTYWTVAAAMLTASAATSALLYGGVNLGWSDSTGANIGDTSRLNNGQFLISADSQHLTPGSMDNV